MFFHDLLDSGGEFVSLSGKINKPLAERWQAGGGRYLVVGSWYLASIGSALMGARGLGG